jgi:hypothetical protein
MKTGEMIKMKQEVAAIKRQLAKAGMYSNTLWILYYHKGIFDRKNSKGQCYHSLMYVIFVIS